MLEAPQLPPDMKQAGENEFIIDAEANVFIDKIVDEIRVFMAQQLSKTKSSMMHAPCMGYSLAQSIAGTYIKRSVRDVVITLTLLSESDAEHKENVKSLLEECSISPRKVTEFTLHDLDKFIEQGMAHYGMKFGDN